jgi:hypothetical protein
VIFVRLDRLKENEFEERHYKLLTIAENLAAASKVARASALYKHCGFKGATSHIDDKYGIDIDDIYTVDDILSDAFKEKYSLKITKWETALKEDELHIGYLKLEKIAL